MDVGKFLEPDRRIQLSLNVEDVYFDDERIAIEVGAGEERLELAVTVLNSSTGEEVGRENMTTAAMGRMPRNAVPCLRDRSSPIASGRKSLWQ
jgi:hypothetical protein